MLLEEQKSKSIKNQSVKLLSTDETEAEVNVLGDRMVVVAIRCARVPRILVPTTTAKNAVRAGRVRIRAFRIILRTVLVIITVIPVAYPFVYISAHVIDSHAVRLFCSNGMCFFSELSLYHATLSTSLPPEYFSLLPPLFAAYSHSASVGRR